MGESPNPCRRVARLLRARRQECRVDEKGFTLIEIVIAVSLLVIMMVPFADAYVTSFSATTDAHTREVAAMVADSALDQARALDATDEQNGCLLLSGRSAADVQTEWDNPAPGTSQILSDTAQASDTSADCASSSATPLPTSPQKQTVGGQTFEIYYYVGNCWETENTSSSSTNTCTDPANPPSTDYEMYRVIAAVTWSAPQGGCGSSGCDYVTSTLVSATSNPSFDVNPILPYINNTSDTTTFTIDSPGAFQFTSTGFPPPTFSDTAYGNGACTPTTLPSGITLSSTGLLSGTPQPGSVGSDYVMCINATNTSGTGTETFILVVDPIPTSLSVTVSNNGSVTYGNAATLTASLTPTTATGTVTFTSGGNTLCSAIISSGSAICSISSLAAGTYNITANYPANNTYGEAQNTATLTVNPVQTTTAVEVNGSSSAQTITYGSTATLSASVSPSTAPGTVAFTSGGKTLCSASVSSGSATCSPTSLAGGTYAVGATYISSSGNYVGSSSGNSV
ncbi:MAG TPA: Ig-like domain repeat protein, partial [Acidimicrobiales bacterium]|nr:Ig-like domain repeat protein [Acidimicrobiales bacterium]